MVISTSWPSTKERCGDRSVLWSTSCEVEYRTHRRVPCSAPAAASRFSPARTTPVHSTGSPPGRLRSLPGSSQAHCELSCQILERDRPVNCAHRIVARAARSAESLDHAGFELATTGRSKLDPLIGLLSDFASYSRLWLGIAGGLALLGGNQGRRAAARGLLAVGAASVVANLGVKPVLRRDRPQRPARLRHSLVAMPASPSFPSGHTASAFAFGSAVGRQIPSLAGPLLALAGAVGYSRIRTGVHYPADVLGGAVVGIFIGNVVGGSDASPSRLRFGNRAPGQGGIPSRR